MAQAETDEREGKRLICTSCGRPTPRAVIQRRYQEHLDNCSPCRSGWACPMAVMYQQGLEVAVDEIEPGRWYLHHQIGVHKHPAGPTAEAHRSCDLVAVTRAGG